MSPQLSHRALYSDKQVMQYFQRISLPSKYHDTALGNRDNKRSPAAALCLLTALQRHSLASIPFENLSLHYSKDHSISIDPSHLFEKIVTRNNGRGGYCMENNSLFGTVLRSLGYHVTSVGARICKAVEPNGTIGRSETPQFTGWSHMVNIVDVGDEQYMVDVGMGAQCQIRPLLLKSGDESEVEGISPARSRLVKQGLPEHTDPRQFVWVNQYQFDGGQPWCALYCFTETEFLPQDFDTLSYAISTRPTSWFRRMIVCSKMVLGGLDGEEVVAVVSLFENQAKKGGREIGGLSDI